jgi:hypothetical protein
MFWAKSLSEGGKISKIAWLAIHNWQGLGINPSHQPLTSAPLEKKGWSRKSPNRLKR